MKRKLLLLLTLSLLLNTYAQENAVNIGLELSPLISFANTPDNESVNNGFRPGLHYGLNLDFNLSDRFTFNTGVFGSLRGAKVTYGNTFQFEKSLPGIDVTPGSEVLYKMQYLEIPTNIKLKTNRINKSSFFALLGVSHRFNIASRTDITRATEDDEYIKIRTRKDMRFYDVPLNVGFGLDYEILDNMSAIFGLKYSHGLIDINKRDDSRVTLSDVQLTIGLLF